jgi:hypothetical protein
LATCHAYDAVHSYNFGRLNHNRFDICPCLAFIGARE